MVRILCIDTDPAAAEALRAAGHAVFAGSLGYTDGRPRLATPPHEVDIIVCDLRMPACFDTNEWGPGRNDNFQCTIVEQPGVAWRIINGQHRPRFKIIQQPQMAPRPPRSFTAEDVHRAVSKAGIPMLLLLNPEGLNHVGDEPLDVCGVIWRFAMTRAERITLREPVWHGLTAEEVRGYSPILSERLAVSTDRGLDAVVRAVVDVVRAAR